jgi:hypothetical protein
VLLTRAVARFRCLGEACEDDCCHGWSVPVERLTYARLKDRLPEGELRASLVRARRPREDASYASMRLDEHERCAFLAPSRLCSLHGRFGAETLPAICASYPRTAARAGDTVEVHGFLSCPEMARLALLADDGLDLVSGSLALRTEVGAARDPARAVALAALALPRPLPLRLLAPAGWEEGAHDAARAAALVRNLLVSRQDDRLGPLVRAALARQQDVSGLEPILERYARAFWQREGGADLMMGTLVLLTRIGILRFLIRGQTGVALDRAAIGAIYRFSRAVEHEAGFVAEIHAALTVLVAEGTAPAVARALAFDLGA